MQIVLIDTIMGPKPLRAPDGWEFDKTGVIVWAALLSAVRLKPTLGKDKHAREQLIFSLANILSSALGMASPYWIEQAGIVVNGKEC